MGGVVYRLKSRLVNSTGYMRGTVHLKYARSTLEERLDVCIVYSNERRTFCIFLVTVWKLFLASVLLTRFFYTSRKDFFYVRDN